MLGLECVEQVLKHVFYHYGRLVSQYHFIFLVGTVLVTAAMVPGLTMINYEGNVYELFTPTDAQSKEERAIYEELFLGVGDENSLPSRLIHDTRIGQVIFEAKDDRNILTSAVMEEIMSLHFLLMNITVYDGENSELSFQFDDLCLMWQGECLENSVLDFYDYTWEEVDEIEATYPYATNPAGDEFNLQGDLGGVTTLSTPELDDQEVILHVKSMRITYFLRAIKEDDNRRSKRWENEFQKTVRKFPAEMTKIVGSTSELVNQEIDATVKDAIFLGAITFVILIIFCTFACMMADWVFSKPWLGMVGMLTACLSLIAAFGIMGYSGIPFAVLAGATPFLILGIGLDDTYVALSAWRQTYPQTCVSDKSVKERMGEALSEAAMSITITSLTDALAFGIGAISNFPAIRYFSLYCCVAVVFCYIYQLSFFAPCLALSGKREMAGLHGCCCCFVPRPSDDFDHWCSRCLHCAGGERPERDARPVGSPKPSSESKSTPLFMVCFKEFYGPVINIKWVMIGVIFVYFCYLGVSIWGCTQIERGLPEENLVRDGSEAQEYYKLKSEYFGLFGPQIAVIVTEELDYSNSDIQYEVEAALSAMEYNMHVYDRRYTASWLRTYLLYLQAACLLPLPSENFIDVLRTRFLVEPQFKHFMLDVVFNDDNSTIVSSRFFLNTMNTTDIQSVQSHVTSDVRRRASQSPLPLIVYSPTFLFSDQYLSMWSNTWQSLGITFAIMFAVSIILIPYVTCAFVVTLSVASIVIGVMGFMGIAEISLSPVSMINLILCIGFSVDFSAHICYAFVTASNEDGGDSMKLLSYSEIWAGIQENCCDGDFELPERPTNKERSIHSLYSLGFPILQGALSTIFSVLALSWSSAYVFRVFFQTMALVIAFGAVHGLVFLPVFLRIVVGEGERMIAKFLAYLAKKFAIGVAGICQILCADLRITCCVGIMLTSFIFVFIVPLFINEKEEIIPVYLPTPNPFCPLPSLPAAPYNGIINASTSLL